MYPLTLCKGFVPPLLTPPVKDSMHKFIHVCLLCSQEYKNSQPHAMNRSRTAMFSTINVQAYRAGIPHLSFYLAGLPWAGLGPPGSALICKSIYLIYKLLHIILSLCNHEPITTESQISNWSTVSKKEKEQE